MSTVVDIRNLGVSFATDAGAVKALDDVSITVQRGEVVAIVGESGSGKTVTAKTILGLNFGYLLSGAAVVETVFARPGIGRIIVEGILNKDFPLVQGMVLLTATTYLLVNLLTDLSYAIIDPRIRLES